MKKLYPIFPFTSPARGQVELPGSKSITNRALLLGAMTGQSVTLKNALFSRDTAIMAHCLQKLGYDIRQSDKEKWIQVTGPGHVSPVKRNRFDVGNAGTTARFLTAFCCLQHGGKYLLDGDPAMRERPMKGLLDALVSQGARINFHENPGCFPFDLTTDGLRGGHVVIDASASSQILSAILLMAPLADNPVSVQLKGDTVSHPFVDMTLRMMGQFGQPLEEFAQGELLTFAAPNPYSLKVPSYTIEADATAASYFLTLPLVTGGEVELPGLVRDSLQGDIAFGNVLEKTGLRIERRDQKWIARFQGAKRAGVEEDFNPISDTFLTLAAIAPLLDSPTKITGIEHTRKQETDRVMAVSRELEKLGQKVTQKKDSITIHPNRKALHAAAQTGAVIETYDDHRMAMSFAILGCYDARGNGSSWLTISDPNCVGKTFPEFFKELEKLRRE